MFKGVSVHKVQDDQTLILYHFTLCGLFVTALQADIVSFFFVPIFM